jgi:plasmid stabilization system protein ParE
VRVSFSDSALLDLEQIIQYYEDKQLSHVGQELVTGIIERVESLPDHPDIGRKVPEFEDHNIRELIKPPFRIVYIKEKSNIFVVRVWRSERLLVLSDDTE